MSSAPSSRTEPSNLEAERTGTQQAGNHGDGIQHQTSAGSRGEGGLSVGAASFTPGAAGGIGDFEPPAAGAAIISGASQGHGQGRHGRNGRGRGGLSRELQAHGHSRSDGGGRHSRGRGGGRRHEDASAVGSTTGGGLPAVKPAAQSGQALHEGVMGSSPGRRGFLNANHLLGFQTSRRDGESGGGRGGGRGARGPGGRGPPRRPPPKPQPYDRNKFLQANFRFLLSDAVDARRFQRDPDLMLEWEDVVQVEMLSAQPVRCPITLDERPFCPQITPCGHVFSFPAIVGHLVSHGGPELRKSAPCPLCYTQIAARELRLVQVHRVEAPGVGQPATFQLLRRPRDSIIPQDVGSGMGGSPKAAPPPAGGSPGKGRQPAGKPARSAAGVDPAGKRAWGGAAGSGGGAPGPERLGSAAGVAAGASAANRFCKFTLVGEATPLFVAEAKRLAQHAAQVTAEGGLEAAYEAPNIYSAIDAVAARARAAAERRQRLLLEAADPFAQDALLSPEEAGAQAAAAVKGATTAALSAAAVQRERAAAAAAREEAFPSLASAAGPVPVGAAAAARAARPRAPPAAPAADIQPAFSDDEGNAEAKLAAAPAGPSQPATAAVPIASGPASSGSRAGAAGSQADDLLVDAGGPDRGTAELSSSVRSAGGGMLGSSPGAGGAGGQGGDGQPSGDFYFYQAADGQWLFLCALNIRMLLAHFGSYAACPPAMAAKVLELEDVVQDEASRRRMRVLAHLPLTATFKLCEVDLSSLLPAEALAPFAEELAQREKRRVQRAKQEARRLKQERAAAAAAAAAAANTGLSAAELRAMPLPAASLLPAGMERQAEEDSAATVEAAAGGAGGAPEEPPPTPPQPGVSFARIARDGFAATGPSLSSQVDDAFPTPGGPAAAPPPAPRGAWGAPKPAAGSPAAAGAWGAAAAGGGAAGAAAQQAAGLQVGTKGGKGKGKVVLFGAPQRRY